MGATIFLFLVGVVLPYLFYLDTGHELRQLMAVGHDYLPPLPKNVLRGVQAVVFTSFLLIVSSAWPALFGLSFVCVKALESWGAGQAKAKIRDGIDRLLASEVPQANKDAAAVLRSYYFERPWDLQLGLVIIALAIGTSLASFSAAHQDATITQVGQVVASAIFVLTFLANELFAARWRGIRDKALAPQFR